jgi:hypothetical protein
MFLEGKRNAFSGIMEEIAPIEALDLEPSPFGTVPCTRIIA